jgi:hypothetical protein
MHAAPSWCAGRRAGRGVRRTPAASPTRRRRWRTGPVKRPRDQLEELNRALPTKVLKDLRISVNRGRPSGDAEWVKRIAARLGLESLLRGVGRPRKTKADH